MNGAQLKGRLVYLGVTVLLGAAAVAFAVPLL
jgi:hypothetical protein